MDCEKRCRNEAYHHFYHHHPARWPASNCTGLARSGRACLSFGASVAASAGQRNRLAGGRDPRVPIRKSSELAVSRVAQRLERTPSDPAAERDAKLRAVAAHLDRPAPERACRGALPRSQDIARARGEPVRQIAEREGVSTRSVIRVTRRNGSFLSPPPPSPASERDAKLRAVAAHLDRPALKTWSAAHDAIFHRRVRQNQTCPYAAPRKPVERPQPLAASWG